MTPAALAIAESIRQALDDLRELEKSAPADVDAIVRSLVDHLRAWKPTSIAPLSILPAPSTKIVDPRGSR